MAIVKGASRSNGAQLGHYLEHGEDNENVYVLDIQGTAHPKNLTKSLLEMSLTSELTRGRKGLYHLQFSPEIGEDRRMPPRSWIRAAQIIEKHLRLTGQKRVIVLHEKEGRIHGHMVWERYNHQTGKLISMSKSYEKHDKARAEIEKVLGHRRTYQAKEATPAQKESKQKSDAIHTKILTEIWRKTKDGVQFVKAAEKAGYQIAIEGSKRPWRVITPDGQEQNLVRRLDKDIKTKEVTERLNPIRKNLKTIPQALSASKSSRNAGEKETNSVIQKQKSVIQTTTQKPQEEPKQVIQQKAPSLPEIMQHFRHNLGEDYSRQTAAKEYSNNEKDMTERERSRIDELYLQMQQNKHEFD